METPQHPKIHTPKSGGHDTPRIDTYDRVGPKCMVALLAYCALLLANYISPLHDIYLIKTGELLN